MGLFSGDPGQTQEMNPWPPTLTGLHYGTHVLGQLMQQDQPFYPGETFAPITAPELRAQEILNQASAAYPGALGAFAGPMQQAWGSALWAPQTRTDIWQQNVMDNPALAGVSQRIMGDVMRNLQENILPSLDLSAVGAGAFGGTRHAIAQGLAGRGASEAVADALADMYGSAWSQGLGAETARLGQAYNTQMGALAQTPMLSGMTLAGLSAPAALSMQAGQLERAEEQRAIDEEMARWAWTQEDPWARVTRGMGALMGPAQAFGETQSRTTGSMGLGGALGSAMGLAGGIGAMGGPMGFGWWGGGGGIPTPTGFTGYNPGNPYSMMTPTYF